MRSKKLIRNVLFYFIEIIAAFLAGFIIPKLIIKSYGSDYNGLVASITQFLELSVLLRAGIGGATMVALYKPLDVRDSKAISGIVNATQLHMNKIGGVLSIIIVIGAIGYPLVVKDSPNFIYTAALFLIIGLGSLIENFFGITNYIVLSADQKIWITSVLKTICYVLTVITSCVLINRGVSLLVVKAVGAIVFAIYPIALKVYVTKAYNIDPAVQPNLEALDQRWDAFFHQVSNYVMNNTDIVLLTLFTDLYVVSVYSVYYLVVSGVKKIVLAFSNGLEASFGNMMAKDEKRKLVTNLGITETIIYGIATIIYTTTAILILEFVAIYTKGVNDAQYRAPLFAYTFVLSQFFFTVRIPYQFVVQAAGKYRETKRAAIIEPVLNIVISIIMIKVLGLVGVAIGTLVASIYRTVQFSYYMSKNVVIRPYIEVIKKLIVSVMESALSIYLVKLLIHSTSTNYLTFFTKGIMVFGIISIVVVVANLIFFHKEMIEAVKKVMSVIKGR